MYEKQKTCPEKITRDLRRQVLYRDRYTCQSPECGLQDLTGKSLVVHHWDHNPANNFRSNLVTVCNSCNVAESNFHRSYPERFQDLIIGPGGWKTKQLDLLDQSSNG